MIEALMNNSIVWAILSLCTLIGVPSFIYAIVTRNKKELSFARHGSKIISVGSKMVSKMTVFYNDQEVESVTVSRYAIWNSGNEVIENDSFVREKPLSISVKNNSRILDVSILDVTDEDNHFEVANCTETEVMFRIEYLNPKDGAVVQVVHTGEKQDVEVSCKIKGGRKMYEYNPRIRKPAFVHDKGNVPFAIKMDMLSMFAVLLFMVVISTLGQIGVIPQSFFISTIHSAEYEIRTMQIMAAIFGVIYLGMIWLTLHRFYNIRIPAKLRNCFLETDEET